jgi:hypothetical protein
MPRIASWDNLPPNVRQHLIDRMRACANARSLSPISVSFVFGSHPGRKFRRGIGTRTSAPSKSVATARTRKRSFFVARSQKVKPFRKTMVALDAATRNSVGPGSTP